MIIAKSDISGEVIEFDFKDGVLSGTEEQIQDLSFVVIDAWNEPAFHVERFPEYAKEQTWKCTYDIIGYDCLLNGEVYGYGESPVEALKNCEDNIKMLAAYQDE